MPLPCNTTLTPLVLGHSLSCNSPLGQPSSNTERSAVTADTSSWVETPAMPGWWRTQLEGVALRAASAVAGAKLPPSP